MKIRHLAALVGILAGLPASGVMAAGNQESTKTTSKVFSLHLGTTRVIYNLDSSGASLTVMNDLDYPMLVQSEVLAENQKDPAPFVVTPPLFRLDALQSSRLRIVRTGGGVPEDRESLQWLCVKGIPPKHDDRWAEEKGADKKKADKATLQVNLSVSSCVKLFVRPPFYINISELSVGGKEVKEHRYISPYSSYEYEIPSGASGKVSWTVITDYGGKSKPFESELKS